MRIKLDAVLKVGGSLSRGDGLGALCGEISRLGGLFNLLVVPGGGEFADQVRNAHIRFNLSETASHCMALAAMDQYGYLLNHLIEESVLTADLSSVCPASGSGKAVVFLPSRLVLEQSSLPHSWQVTSDTISAWIARHADCRRLILLKDVDGLQQDGLIKDLTVNQLSVHRGGVDEYLSHFLSSADLETWVINGLRPWRLTELLEKGYTTGTRIRRN